MQYRIERLTFGGVLDQAFTLMRDHFVRMVAMYLVVFLPFGLVNGLRGEPATPAEALSPDALLIAGVSVLILMVVWPFAQLVVTSTVLDAYLSRPGHLNDTLARARASYMPYVGTSFLATILATLLLIPFIFPGVYFFLCWSLIGPVAVMEQQFGMAALKRSRALTRGHLNRISGIMFVAVVLTSVVGGMLSILFSQIPVLGAVLNSAVNAVTSTFTSAVVVVLYIDLRCRHENFDVQLLADQIAQHDSLRPRGLTPSVRPS